ncbi:MAG TPA: sugar phosphate isomerase/epimerase [Nitrososphaera sp.]|nr:sugar phosphate isomerase/epimerase [Nitrososphaera sp.]
MKYSITLASFRNVEPLEQSLARLAPQGFDAVEMYGEPEDLEMNKLKDAFSTGGLPVCGITGMWGRVSRHGWKRKLLSTEHDILAASEKYVRDCVSMCNQLGGNEVNICLFGDDSDNRDMTHAMIGAKEKEKAAERALPSLATLCKEARDSGVTLVLEPLNRYSTPYCATAADALAVARRIDGLGILLDTFHMNIEEDRFSDAILSCRDILMHTHFADNNRKMPGFGHTDFGQIVSSLKEIGYGNYISFEPNIPDRNYEGTTKRGLEIIRGIESALDGH